MDRPLECIHVPPLEITYMDLSYYKQYLDTTDNRIHVWHNDMDCYERSIRTPYKQMQYATKYTPLLKAKPDIRLYIPIEEGQKIPLSVNFFAGSLFGPKILYPCPECVIKIKQSYQKANLSNISNHTVFHLMQMKFTDTGKIAEAPIKEISKLKPFIMYFPQLNAVVWVIRSHDGNIYLYKDFTIAERDKYMPKEPYKKYDPFDYAKFGLSGLVFGSIISIIEDESNRHDIKSFLEKAHIWIPSEDKWKEVPTEDIKMGPAPEMPGYNPLRNPTDYEWNKQQQKWVLKTESTTPKLKDDLK